VVADRPGDPTGRVASTPGLGVTHLGSKRESDGRQMGDLVTECRCLPRWRIRQRSYDPGSWTNGRVSRLQVHIKASWFMSGQGQQERATCSETPTPLIILPLARHGASPVGSITTREGRSMTETPVPFPVGEREVCSYQTFPRVSNSLRVRGKRRAGRAVTLLGSQAPPGQPCRERGDIRFLHPIPSRGVLPTPNARV